ncbi:MAG: hypothetical protein SNJ84_02785 [Verrucomicrobiia bacterium]
MTARPDRPPPGLLPPVLLAALALFLLAALLAGHTALSHHQRALLTAETTLLRDERRTLENQLKQLRREYLDKESALRARERDLSATEQERLNEELTRLRREQRRLTLATLADTLQTQLRSTANNPNIEVLSESDQFLIRFPESTLFNPNETTPSRLGNSLLALLKPHWSESWHGTTTHIHVHADSVPPGATSRFPSPWEWTAARAASIARTLQSLDPLLAHSLHPIGRGNADADNPSPPPAGPRRIDLILRFP